jgi:signal transduction histidine kinase
LNNASIHSEKGGRIWLTVKEKDGDVLISVRDTGVGIDVEQLPRIFEMFWRAKSGHERAPGGLGIGLSLVKAVIELQGGKVEAYSAGVGMGSEFTISLPAATKAPSSQDTGNEEASARRRQPHPCRR